MDFHNKNSIICAYNLAEQAELDPKTIASIGEHMWVHMDATHDNTVSWLQNNVSEMDPLMRDALLATETRPRLLNHKGCAVLILRGVNLNENAEPEDMISIRVWTNGKTVITTRIRQLKAVQDIVTNIEKGQGPQNSTDFITTLMSRLFKRMEPVVRELDERTDDIEELILDSLDSENRKNITEIRRRAIILRRYIAPQKDLTMALRNSEFEWLDNKNRRHVQEHMDHLTRYIEDLDAIRERAQIVKEEFASILSDRLNKNMYVLSIVAAIFLPLGFLTGLLGINVGGLPGVESDMAFWIVCIICAGFSAFTLLLFKILKWI